MGAFSDTGAKILEGVAAGLYEGGTIVMAESQRLVPVETGVLKNSGVVNEPVVEGDAIVVEVGYGYGDAYEAVAASGEGIEGGPGYAIYVHEILDNRHDPPTQAKFLETPARALEPELGPVVDAAVRARLRGR